MHALSTRSKAVVLRLLPLFFAALQVRNKMQLSRRACGMPKGLV